MTLPDLNEISKEIYSYQVGNYCHVLTNSETASYGVRISAVPSLCAVNKFIPIAYSPVHVISHNLVLKLQTTIIKHVLGYYSWTGFRMWLKHNVIINWLLALCNRFKYKRANACKRRSIQKQLSASRRRRQREVAVRWWWKAFGTRNRCPQSGRASVKIGRMGKMNNKRRAGRDAMRHKNGPRDAAPWEGWRNARPFLTKPSAEVCFLTFLSSRCFWTI